MKNLKKLLCMLLVLGMIFTMTSCRKPNSDGSSYVTEVESEIIYENVEITQSGTGSGNANTNTNTNGTSSHGSSKPTGSSSKPSSNQQTAASSGSSDIVLDNLPAYTGNLPTISKNQIPNFSNKQLELSGFWAPYELSEASLNLYKDAGFNTLAFVNHSASWTSDNQFYLGSNRTMKALELCRKVGLKATLCYNDWIGNAINGSNYMGDTPFSKHDKYSEYKDIIVGVHIVDEPNLSHMNSYSKTSMIEDFKKVYPNADYIVNLMPKQFYANLKSDGENSDFKSYDEMISIYEEKFMKNFSNPYISVDVYPFRESKFNISEIVDNYNIVAKSAKKFGSKPAYILQSSAGGAEKFTDMTEGDLRLEINAALAYGADTLQYYCYAVPRDGNSSMYKYCILNPDNTPSPIYYSLQKIHKEIQGYSNVVLAYDWDMAIGRSGYEKTNYFVANIEYDQKFNKINFDNAKHFIDASSSYDLLISRFTNKNYGEAYMFANVADRHANNVNIRLRNCTAVAVYGENGFNGTPRIADVKNGTVTLNLEYGEGAFVVPLA